MCKNDKKENDSSNFIKDLEEGQKVKSEQTIVVDWLTISFTKQMPDIDKIRLSTSTKGRYIINETCYLQYSNDKINDFNDTLFLFIKKKYIGRLLLNPTKNIDRNTVHLILENSLFYENDFTQYIDYLIINLDFKLNHLNRLDIANDFINHFIIPFFGTFERSRNISKKGRAKYKPEKDGKKNIESVIIGSANSRKQISIYKKGEDLQRIPKPYIQEFWGMNQMDYILNEVERIELRLRTEELRDVDYHKLSDPNYLATLCRLHFKNFFEFEASYKENGKYRKKDVTPIDINFKHFETLYLKRLKSSPREGTKRASTYLKNLYNSLLKEQYLLNKESNQNQINSIYIENNLKMISRHLELYPDLNELYDRKKLSWEHEYKNKHRMYYNDIITLNNDMENEAIDSNSAIINNENLKDSFMNETNVTITH